MRPLDIVSGRHFGTRLANNFGKTQMLMNYKHNAFDAYRLSHQFCWTRFVDRTKCSHEHNQQFQQLTSLEPSQSFSSSSIPTYLSSMPKCHFFLVVYNKHLSPNVCIMLALFAFRVVFCSKRNIMAIQYCFHYTGSLESNSLIYE